jgi:CRISPR-associated protein Cmr5
MSNEPIPTRDQQRALHAYEVVGAITDKAQQKDYKIAVHALCADILRSGLAAAMAGLERRESKAELLRGHLVSANIPGLVQPRRQDIPILKERLPPKNLPAKIRALPLDDYILATRETLQVVLWLKRAVQAKFEGV